MHVYDMRSSFAILDVSGKGFGIEGYSCWEDLALAAMWRCIEMQDKDAALLIIDQLTEHTKNRIIETFGEEIKQVVFEALENAEENGCTPLTDFAFRTVESVVSDLKDYCSELEGVTMDDIQPHVEEWLLAKRYTLWRYTVWK